MKEKIALAMTEMWENREELNQLLSTIEQEMTEYMTDIMGNHNIDPTNQAEIMKDMKEFMRRGINRGIKRTLREYGEK